MHRVYVGLSPFLDLSEEVGDGEAGGAGTQETVEEATGLAAATGSNNFLLWLQSFVISLVLPWSGHQGRVATCDSKEEQTSFYLFISFHFILFSFPFLFFYHHKL